MKNINPFETASFISLHFSTISKSSFGNIQYFFPPFVSLAVFCISYCHFGETSLLLTLQREQHLHTLSTCISYKHPYQHSIYSRGKLIKLWM